MQDTNHTITISRADVCFRPVLDEIQPINTSPSPGGAEENVSTRSDSKEPGRRPSPLDNKPVAHPIMTTPAGSGGISDSGAATYVAEMPLPLRVICDNSILLQRNCGCVCAAYALRVHSYPSPVPCARSATAAGCPWTACLLVGR